MNDRQVFVVIIGGILFAMFGGTILLVLVELIVHVSAGHINGGDDIGWGLLWLLLTVISGILGAVFSGKWARKRYGNSGA